MTASDLTALPRHFRVIGDRHADIEMFIPAYRGFIERLMRQDLSQSRKAAMAEAEANRLAEALTLKSRHADLIARHVASPIVATLLDQHSPAEAVHGGTTYLECHGCPESHDIEYGESYQSWPCPTWQTISDSTP